MEQLLEEYKRKLKRAKELLVRKANEGDGDATERIVGKIEAYREVISDIKMRMSR